MLAAVDLLHSFLVCVAEVLNDNQDAGLRIA